MGLRRGVAKIFYIRDYRLNRLPKPAPAAEAKIIPFKGKPPEPFEERARMEGLILLGYRRFHSSDRTGDYLACYLPETGPRFVRICFLHEDKRTGKIEAGIPGRIRGSFALDEDAYTYTDAVCLAPPSPATPSHAQPRRTIFTELLPPRNLKLSVHASVCSEADGDAALYKKVVDFLLLNFLVGENGKQK
jgi:hypothetical protein